MKEDFFISLPSNVSSTDYFASNSIGNYVTKLARRIKLDGKWEVALMELSYTKSWYNLSFPEKMSIYDKQFEKIATLVLEEGYYNISDLIQSMNDGFSLLADEMEPPLVEFNKHSGKVHILPGKSKEKGYLYPFFSENICNMLGITDTYRRIFNRKTKVKRDVVTLVKYLEQDIGDDQVFTKGYNLVGDTPIDISGGYHSFYLYTDIIEPMLVGDSYTKLLRTIEVPDKPFGTQIVIKYNNPQYQPLLYHEIETVEIDIKDDTNKTVPFKFGRVIATLHFRNVLR